MAAFRSFRRRYLASVLPTNEQVRLWRAGLLHRFGVARSREPRWLVQRPDMRINELIGYVVGDLVARRGELNFLQVGAFDGQLGDQLNGAINRYPSRGVLVEPQPGAFARLQATYAGREGLSFVNAAIDRESGERDFYTPSWGDSVLSSFDRRHLLKHSVPEDEIVVTRVPCRTVDSVLEEAGLPRLDLLLIDTEGHDAVVLASVDLQRWRPAVVRFELTHLSEEETSASLERLAEHGYRFYVEQYDLIAIRQEDAGKDAIREAA